MEARMGRDRGAGSVRSTTARPEAVRRRDSPGTRANERRYYRQDMDLVQLDRNERTCRITSRMRRSVVQCIRPATLDSVKDNPTL